ncbi:uncharacterized protein LOC120473591 isoform X1 [Pimephales promelas]|uniref:uncharacterized protein LOC120473591 isoform X1 n=1 Tax=Pimephales promelas TaxID=90988 RepID=UPI001955CAD9|nr:uncharacterized protein LOC120473591 isoform X1 [Pimephales promelas]
MQKNTYCRIKTKPSLRDDKSTHSKGEVCLHLSTLNHPPLLLNTVGFSLKVNMLKMFKATTCSTSHGMKHVIDATKEDTSLGPLRLVNDDKNPNCKVKTIIVDGRPHLCLCTIRHIFPDEEVTYNYGDSSWPWRLRELCDETSVAVTECSVNPSSSVKQKELCDETSVAVTECSVNPSSSVKQKELCDETSVAVTECSVNPSSSVKQKELCDETSVAVTECSVNPSSSVKQKELCDETSVAVTECSVNPSSTVKQKELCDETSVAVTECSVNPSSSVKQKEKDK